MSMNKALNAVIALVENKPDIARAYFRDPNSDILNVGEATARLYSALDHRFAIELRMLLVKLLEAEPSSMTKLKPETKGPYIDGFYDGVRQVEQMIERLLVKLES